MSTGVYDGSFIYTSKRRYYYNNAYKIMCAIHTCTASVSVLSRIRTNMIYSNWEELMILQNFNCDGFLGM